MTCCNLASLPTFPVLICLKSIRTECFAFSVKVSGQGWSYAHVLTQPHKQRPNETDRTFTHRLLFMCLQLHLYIFPCWCERNLERGGNWSRGEKLDACKVQKFIVYCVSQTNTHTKHVTKVYFSGCLFLCHCLDYASHHHLPPLLACCSLTVSSLSLT